MTGFREMSEGNEGAREGSCLLVMVMFLDRRCVVLRDVGCDDGLERCWMDGFLAGGASPTSYHVCVRTVCVCVCVGVILIIILQHFFTCHPQHRSFI